MEDNEKVREPAYKMTQAITKIDGYENTSTMESKSKEGFIRHVIHVRKKQKKTFPLE